ncbi:MAG: hypothetical protein KC591_08590 [Gemmatimonadetes bacterium]|nr:hypothetical protein [Gemmatimonadota bacterium]
MPLVRAAALVIIAVALALFVWLRPAAAGVVSIMPSTIEATVEPGGDVTTTVRVHYGKDGPEDTQPIRVLVTTEGWDMDDSGRLSFDDGEPLPGATTDARDWIVFSPGEAEIRPGETLTMRVSIVVPEDASRGEYRAALIAQPRLPYREQRPGTRRLDLLCRLASIVYVKVPPLADSVELDGLRIARTESAFRVVPRLLNGGETTVRVFDSFEILPLDGDPVWSCRRDSEESGVVLPGRSREFAENLPCDLPAGTYSLLYRADVGAEHPVLEGETSFVVSPEGTIVAAGE